MTMSDSSRKEAESPVSYSYSFPLKDNSFSLPWRSLTSEILSFSEGLEPEKGRKILYNLSQNQNFFYPTLQSVTITSP